MIHVSLYCDSHLCVSASSHVMLFCIQTKSVAMQPVSNIRCRRFRALVLDTLVRMIESILGSIDIHSRAHVTSADACCSYAFVHSRLPYR